MPVRFHCPSCRQSLKASDEKIGKKFKCPKCGTVVSVPARSEPKPQPPEDGSQAETDEATGTAADTADESVDETDDDTQTLISEWIVYDDDLAYELSGKATQDAAAEFDRNLVSVTRRVLYFQGGLIAVVGILGLVVGLIIGSTVRPQPGGNGGPLPPQAAKPVELTVALSYQAVTGTLKDKGALVLALPEKAAPAEGEPKLSTAGLVPIDLSKKPNKPPPAAAAIRKLGGALVHVNEQGKCSLELKAGNYYLLYLSQATKRDKKTPPNREHLGELGQFFEKPETLLADHRYHFKLLEISANISLRHDFGKK